jgi:hypothetical protein
VSGLIRVIVIAGFVLTLVGAGFFVIYASLAEGSYEPADRSEPWEWVAVASFAGGIAAGLAIGGLAARWPAGVVLGALAQAIAVAVVLALALPNLDSGRSDFERNLVVVASLVLLFDAAVLLSSFVSQRRNVR